VAGRSSFRTLRIALLLYLLLMVAVGSWYTRQRSTSWEQPLWVAVYPVAGDDSQRTRDYVQDLSLADFAPLEAFFERQAAPYALQAAPPLRMELAPPIPRRPPARDPGSGILGNVLWSLRTRWYAWSVAGSLDLSRPDIQLFAVYHDPSVSTSVPHSAGLRQGLVGVAHLFATASQRDQNLLVIAHELLHTLGASDKYRSDSNQPLFPQGYAEPARQPLYPQPKAEIMAGRLPLSPSESRMPDSLEQAVIGPHTAMEIRWSRP